MSASTGHRVLLEPRRRHSGRVWLSWARWLAVFTLLGAAVIHASVIREHLEEWPAAGVAFILLASLETVLAVVLLARWSILIGLSIVAVSTATILLWAFSRTAGMPIGPEPVGKPDVVATLLEATTILSILPFLRRPVASVMQPLGSAPYIGIGALGASVGTLTWLGLWPR